MALKVYLAVDLGAESGRVTAGLWNGRRLQLEEVHRFPNGPVDLGDTLRWDVLRLWSEVQSGLGFAARKFGGNIVSVGVDTWGVDFVLLNQNDELLGQPFHYRDNRTRGLIEEACKLVPKSEIFRQSGLEFMEFNSLYQLMAWQRRSPSLLTSAKTLLFMPDFLHWAMCGIKRAEFTIASTSQFLNPRTGTWSRSLLGKLQLPSHFLPPIVPPGTVLGSLRRSLAERFSLPRVRVVAPPSHDTASAVAGVPTAQTGQTNWAFLSSGTWSLMGLELPKPVLTPRALELGLTNEGGIGHTALLLKNIMGLWLVQQCKRAFESAGRRYGYTQLAAMARKSPGLRSLINPDDSRFLNPPDMVKAIQGCCSKTGQPIPTTAPELIRCCYDSLALKYNEVMANLETLAESKIKVIHIVGGGSQSSLLNQFTADACQRPVLAGPVEATAMGNIMSQAKADGEVSSLREMRAVVKASSQIRTFHPSQRSQWQEAAEKLRSLRF